MGAKLVSQAFAFAAQTPLKPNERVLLLHMAHTAHDSDKSHRYWASWEQSAFGLGRIVPDEPSPEDPRARDILAARESAAELVRRATQGLMRTGVIRRIRHGGRGHTAEYELKIEEALTNLLMPQQNVGANS